MGLDITAYKNIKIIDSEIDNKVIAVKGSIPGSPKNLVEIIY